MAAKDQAGQKGLPQNILLVHTRYRLPGGEDAVFAAERAMLAAHGHRVVVYERANAEADGSLLQKLLLPLRAVYSFKTLREVRALLRREHIDLVHVHNTLLVTSPSVFWACLKERVPVVQTLHNFRIFCPNGILLREGRVCEDCPAHGLACAVRHRCYRGSRAQSLVCAAVYWFHRRLGTYRKIDLLTLTEFDRAKLLEFNAKTPVFDPARLYVKANPVESAGNAAPIIPWAARRAQYLYAARLEEAKGLKTVAAAWRRLSQTLGESAPMLVIAGSGPLEAWAREACAGLPVRFAGQLPHEELLREMANSRGLIAASLWYETFGLTMVEANAAGTPVLASALGNPGAMVQNGVNGFTFAPGDAEALAEAVVRLEAAGPALDLAAIRAGTARYAVEANYSALAAIYRDILEHHRGNEA